VSQLFTHESNTFLGEQYVIPPIQTNGTEHQWDWVLTDRHTDTHKSENSVSLADITRQQCIGNSALASLSRTAHLDLAPLSRSGCNQYHTAGETPYTDYLFLLSELTEGVRRPYFVVKSEWKVVSWSCSSFNCCVTSSASFSASAQLTAPIFVLNHQPFRTI